MLHRIQKEILKTGNLNVVAGNYVGTFHSILPAFIRLSSFPTYLVFGSVSQCGGMVSIPGQFKWYLWGLNSTNIQPCYSLLRQYLKVIYHHNHFVGLLCFVSCCCLMFYFIVLSLFILKFHCTILVPYT
jgi:hypothetical protein